MRIALVGTRGIPARYGGFETFAEELSQRLVKRGHEVRVYTRQPFHSPTYLGVDVCVLPAPRHKYLETIVHTFVSTLHLAFFPMNAALYCNAANAIFTWIPRVLGMPVALNVDGLERKRKKWNVLAKAWYQMSERLSTIFPTEIITDAVAIQDYYRERYHAASTMIPYGAEPEPVSTRAALDQLGLEPRQYFLFVSRMEPENNGLLVRQCFETLDTPMKLALVGDAPYAHEYLRRVRDTQDPRVVLPGAVFNPGYSELQSHCYAYIQATEVGGTHPALIEAMGRGALVLYMDNPENREVCGEAGLPFTHDTLTEVMQVAVDMPADKRADFGQRAIARVKERYSWDAVTDAYEQLLQRLIR